MKFRRNFAPITHEQERVCFPNIFSNHISLERQSLHNWQRVFFYDIRYDNNKKDIFSKNIV